MSAKIWRKEDVITATRGTASGGDFDATGVSIDSRTLQAGEIFLALKGDAFDGHAFIEKALQAGAAAAIVHQDFVDPTGGKLPLIRVADTQKALEDLGAFARDRARAAIVAVTGSVGKTSTKEMLATVLSEFGKTHYSRKSYNNHLGVPLTLANLPPDADYAVMEVGMNHAGEISALTRQVRPDIAVITTIEPVHIEFFSGIEGIADAKAEIFEGMTSAGIAILNADNPHFLRLKRAAEAAGITDIRPFGEDDSARAQLVSSTLKSDKTEGSAKIGGKTMDFELHVPGKHQAMNALVSYLVAEALALPLDQVAKGLAAFAPVEGRGNRISIRIKDGEPPVTLIDESYNASPASMRAAFKVLEMATPQGQGRRIAVLGDMLELGREGAQLHADLANPLLMAKTDKLYACGPLMGALYDALPSDWQGAHAKNSQELAALLVKEVRPGDVIVVKGSLGSRMAYIVQALRDLDRGQTAKNGAANVNTQKSGPNKNAL